MRIDISDKSPGTFQAVVVSHGDVELPWSTITYGKLKFHNLGRMFEEYNEHMSKQSPEVQAKVFDAYLRIWAVLTPKSPQRDALGMDEKLIEVMEDVERHSSWIRQAVREIYDHYTAQDVDDIVDGVDARYDRLRGICVGGSIEPTLTPEGLFEGRYLNEATRQPIKYLKDIPRPNLPENLELAEYVKIVDQSGKVLIGLPEHVAGLHEAPSLPIRYPKTMLEAFPLHGDNNDRTYRRSDYRDLVKFALRLRPMVPVFGQYTKSLGKDSASGTQYKETSAVALLDDTDVLEGPAMDKLHEYMVYTLKKFSPQKTAGVHRGLGSTELPYWLARKATFRRVAIGELDSGDDLSSIVTNVYNFTKTTLDSMARNFGGVRNKTRTNENGVTSEENISLLESIKVRQAIPDGDKVPVNVYCRNPFAYGPRVEPELPEDLLRECTRITGEWAQNEVYGFQMTLARWVLSAVLSPKDLDLIGRESLMATIGTAQAIIYHWKFPVIAALMTAQPFDDQDIAPTTSLWDREPLGKEWIAKLSHLYPHYRMSGKRDQGVEVLNVGAQGILTLAQEIHQNDWKHSRQAEHLVTDNMISVNGTLLVPPNLKHQLCQILVRSVTGSFV